METSDSTTRPGQPSRYTPSHPSYPMVLSGAQHQSAYSHQPQVPLLDLLNEKADPYSYPSSTYAAPYPTSTLPQQSRSQHPSLPSSYPATSIHYSRAAATSAYTRPRGLRIANLLKPWTPIILYAITSFGFLAAIAFWKTEVFQGK